MTITGNQTVSELAALSLNAVRTFEKRGIDYCCGGKRPIGEVCRERGIGLQQLIAELGAALEQDKQDDRDWNTAPLSELVAHINGKHHEYLKSELPRISERLAKVVRVYGAQDAATLSTLPHLYEALRDELESHLAKEENILFPFVERMEVFASRNRPLPPLPFGTIGNPIDCMEAEHEDAGDALRQMRAATHDYKLPAHACVTYKALFDSLRDLEADLHMHIHLENNILFPRVIEMERSMRGGHELLK
jgi:regulator of cell morphogenesis and NO signaling